MSRGLFTKLEQLAQFLGITLDVKLGDQESASPATWRNPVAQRTAENSISSTSVPEDVCAEELAKALTKDLTNIVPKVLAKAAEKTTKRIGKRNAAHQVPDNSNVVQGAGDVATVLSPAPPNCCWHCNQSFGNLNLLQNHLKSHKGEPPKNIKKHKCQKCKKVS